MENRVYGILGIRAIMSNWNADFSGRPKSISSGEFFGSDKALKYSIKKYMMEEGEKILYTRTYKITEEKREKSFGVKSLKERYEELFQVEDLKNEKDQLKLLKNLFSAADVKNFGATFAENKNNISITGAVQIGQGFNKYDYMQVETQQILSPFRNPKESKDGQERGQASLGNKIMSNEAHYVYPFVINPKVYEDFVKMGATEGYTENDYELLKEAMLLGATYYSTNSKMGCDNELSIFIETEHDLYLPDLSQFVKFEKRDNKNIYILDFGDIINKNREKIKSIEVYYNSYDTEIETEMKGVKYFNIFTKEEIE
ncbi:MAG: type I CRISPR-associated protein Cas7 [Peptoniphilaceae bacterium]